MINILSVDVIESLIIALSVLFIGRFINKLIPKLALFNIPEPILGGLIITGIITILHIQSISVQFDLPLQDTFHVVIL